MRPAVISTGLKQQFLTRLRNREWKPLERIPTEMELARDLGVSRTAVRRALKDLEAEGWLEAVQGSGRRVTRGGKPASATISLLARGSEFAGGGQGSRLLAALSRHIMQRHHSLILHTISESQSERDVNLAPRGVDLQAIDGAIVYAPQYRLEDVARLARRIPVVSIPHDASSVGVASFVVDYSYHACTAINELVRLGHKRIALLTSSQPHRSRLAAEIRRGFDLGRQLAGLPLDDAMIVSYSGADNDDYQELYDTLGKLPEPPTAMICNVLLPLLSVRRIAAARGDSTLLNANLVCLADVADAADAGESDRLADFACDLEQIAAAAVDCLDNMLHGGKSDRAYHPYYGRLRNNNALRPPAG